MIELSNGHRFKYMAASGALAFDGRGWWWEQPLRWAGLLDPSLFASVIKTLTLPPRRGNYRWWKPWDCVRLIPDGAANAFGLTNPGFYWWYENVGPNVNSKKIALMGSILGTPKELAEMAEKSNNLDLVGQEVNISCPNTSDDLLSNAMLAVESCRVVKKKSRHPVIAKLSVAHDIPTIVKIITEEKLAEAFSINSVPWSVVFPGKKSPLAKYGGGGVSGKAAQPFTWELVHRLKHLTDIPVIGPGVWDFDDMAKLRAIGASAISCGSIFLKYPWRPTNFVRRDMAQRVQVF